MVEVRSFIDGQFVNPTEDAWFERFSPVTGEPSARVPDSDVLDVVRAVQAANRAWSLLQKQEPAARTIEARGFCAKIAIAVESAAAELAGLQSEETGMPIAASRASIARAVAELRYFSELELERQREPMNDGRKVAENRLPIGVVVLLLPAYDPVESLVHRLAPALAAGNVVIAKASSHAPRTNDRFAKAVHSSGLTSGVFALLQGRGVRIGRALVEHPGLSTVSFAGKTETGREVQQASAELLKRTQLSLSGCNSILVFGAADMEPGELDRIATAVCDLSLSGLTPPHLRGARVFVQEPLYKRFLEALAAAGSRLKIGDPVNEATTLGPLTRAEEKKRFADSVAQAVSERGKLLRLAVGPLPPVGHFVEPTVVYDVSLCSTLQQEEVLGPLAMVESFKYQHDAIKLANTSPFGQISYVFHADHEKAAKIANRIEASRVVVNPAGAGWELSQTPIGASFGGLKSSGLGREGGLEALEFFSRRALVVFG